MLNQVSLIGNVGQIDVRTVNGKKFINFSIACNENYKDKDGKKIERTNWFKVAVLSENLVNIVENYVKKGDKLFVQGKLSNSSYEKDGQTHYSTDIVLGNFDSKLLMLSPKKENAGNTSTATASPDAYEDIPY